MAKFCISGKDEETGQFYYASTWRSYSHVKGAVKCLCGFDYSLFIDIVFWYQASGTKDQVPLPPSPSYQ